MRANNFLHGFGRGTPSTVPAWLASAAVGEWISISGTALSSVEPATLPATPVSDPSAKIGAWCGAAFDRLSNKYIIGMAGGHGDYAGNEIDVLDLSADAPAWVEVSARSADADIYNRSAFYADMKGGAYHTYQYLQVVDGVLVGFCNPGVDYGGMPNPPYATPGGWAYDNPAGNADGNYVYDWSPSFRLSDSTWLAGDYIPAFPTTSGDWIAAFCVKHPTTNDVYIARNGDRWRKLTASTRTWSTPSANYEQGYCGGAIDPTRNRMLIVGDYNATLAPRVRDLDGAAITVTFGGIGDSVFTTGESAWPYAGVVYDQANDRFLVFKNSNPITVYAVDASTWAVSLLTTTGTSPAQRPNGMHNAAQYVPDLGGRSGIVLANAYTGNVKFLRTA